MKAVIPKWSYFMVIFKRENLHNYFNVIIMSVKALSLFYCQDYFCWVEYDSGYPKRVHLVMKVSSDSMSNWSFLSFGFSTVRLRFHHRSKTRITALSHLVLYYELHALSILRTYWLSSYLETSRVNNLSVLTWSWPLNFFDAGFCLEGKTQEWQKKKNNQTFKTEGNRNRFFTSQWQLSISTYNVSTNHIIVIVH